MITLQTINQSNWMQASRLCVNAKQQDYVGFAVEILARAYAYRDQRAVCWAICNDSEIVGLAMLYDLDEEPACYHLCQFLIDQRFQGRGYGQSALKLVLDHCRREGTFPRVEVCVKKENTAAIHVYKKAGFRDTGYIDPAAPDSLCMVYELRTEVHYRDIILREMQESDIADEIRWNTVETEWSHWDAPWEMEEAIQNFDAEAETTRLLEFIRSPKPPIPYSLEVDTAYGIHIGTVSQYLIDDNFNWISRKDAQEKHVFHTLGIDIAESSYWNRGYGTQALTAWIQYFLTQGIQEICLQTWSGNIRMIRCAEKLGFRECSREPCIRQVRGGSYDGLTFRLDLDRFHKFLSENP